MAKTNFSDVHLDDKGAGAAGDVADQLGRIRADLQALVALANEAKADFNGHTHRCDGAQAGQYNSSTPQGDAQTVAPVTARSVVAADAAVTTA